MKKSVLFWGFFIIVRSFFAQVAFCPAGAEWHYLFSISPTSSSNERIKYARDSVIGGQTAKVLTHKRFFNLGGVFNDKVTLIRQNSDTVFFRNIATQHIWQILYNFAAPQGGGWKTTIDLLDPNTPGTSTFTITIDSTKTVSINGFSLKRLYVKYYDSPTSFMVAEITERLGSNNFMFSYPSFNGDDFFDSFLCYQDNAFGLKQFTNYSCDYFVGISENKRQNSVIEFYPNPVEDELVVKFSGLNFSKRASLEVVDLNGKLVFQEDIYSDKSRIDLKHLKNGLYLVRVSQNGQQLETRKIVKRE